MAVNTARFINNCGLKLHQTIFRNKNIKVQLAAVSRSLCSFKDAGENLNILELKTLLAKSMGVGLGYQPISPSRGHLLELLPKNQEELPSRSMQDSFSSAIIPLSTDQQLQEKYVTFLGHVRTGRLMEDMDIFAVWIAHKHIDNPRQKPDQHFPYTIVTVLVDKVDFTDLIPKPDADIRLSGHVSWVGKSSLEIVVWLEQKLLNHWQKLTRALFLMAARDSTNSQAAFVNPIIPASEREQTILAGGEKRKARRLLVQKESLLKTIPNAEEQNIVHDLFLKTIDVTDPSLNKQFLPSGTKWMNEGTISNMIFSHPEDRNLHNKVFGGFLMRNALELSWSCAYLFTKYRPKLMHISDIVFHKPIEVNSMIRMHATVVYTEIQYLQVIAFAEVFEPMQGVHNTTNVFHFTFAIPEKCPPVLPRTYYEAMMYIDGRRHFQYVMGLTQDTKNLYARL